jgi:two-component system OmpR family sensor kinase
MSAAAPRSLAALLTHRLAAIAAGVLLLNVVIVAVYYGRDLPALQLEAAEAQIGRIERALVSGEGPDEALYTSHPDAYAYAVLDGAGRIVEAANAKLIPAEALATGMFAHDWITRLPGPDGPTVVASHVVEATDPPVRVVFVAASDPANLVERALLNEFVGHIWLPVLPGVLLLLAANALMVRRALRPLAQAATWARSVTPGAPPPPPPDGPMPAEIADLSDAASRSLARLGEALEAEKRRAAEAAHALRTPLAVLTARVDALPRGETTERLKDDLSALSRTVGQLLASASIDALVVGEDSAIDLSAVAEATVAALAPFAIARGVHLGLTRHPRIVPAVGEAGAVALALQNLVENAVLHAGAGGRVDITAGPGAMLEVRDHGPGLPPRGAGALFRPFWRGEDAAAGGAGLGLAVVERVQRAHGGTVEAANHPEGGAVFRLRYRPARRQSAPPEAGPRTGADPGAASDRGDPRRNSRGGEPSSRHAPKADGPGRTW